MSVTWLAGARTSCTGYYFQAEGQMASHQTQRDPHRDHLKTYFFITELWTRSGAWSHFPADDPNAQELIDAKLSHRVTQQGARELREILCDLAEWVEEVEFEEIPGSRLTRAQAETLESEVADARRDTTFRQFLKSVEGSGRKKRGLRRK